jgi:hypothetical protein
MVHLKVLAVLAVFACLPSVALAAQDVTMRSGCTAAYPPGESRLLRASFFRATAPKLCAPMEQKICLRSHVSVTTVPWAVIAVADTNPATSSACRAP